MPSAITTPPIAAAQTRAPSRPRTTGDEGSRPLSKLFGQISGAGFLGSNALEVAQATGVPHWRNVYWLLGGLDHFVLPGIMPRFLKEGPVAGAVSVAASASLVHTAVSQLPGAMQTFRSNLGASHGLGATLRAAMRGAAPSPGGGLDVLSACYSIAVPAMAVSALASSLEYVSRHGTRQLTKTRDGRAAILDAVAGVGFLAQVLLPGSLAATLGWIAGSSAQTIGEVNRRGWLENRPVPPPAR